jgi:hypothetical protein
VRDVEGNELVEVRFFVLVEDRDDAEEQGRVFV